MSSLKLCSKFLVICFSVIVARADPNKQRVRGSTAAAGETKGQKKVFDKVQAGKIGKAVASAKKNAWGLETEDVIALEVTDALPGAENGNGDAYASIYLKQTHEGLILKNAQAVVILQNDQPMRAKSQLQKALKNCLEGVDKKPSLTAQDAIVSAAEDAGLPSFDPDALQVVTPQMGNSQKTVFASYNGLSMSDISCELFWFKVEKPNVSSLDIEQNPGIKRRLQKRSEKGCDVRLSWTCILDIDETRWIEYDVDAHQGEVLSQQNYYHGLTYKGVVQQPRESPCTTCNDFYTSVFNPYIYSRLQRAKNPENLIASPIGWTSSRTSPVTQGNNVIAYLDVSSTNSGTPVSLLLDRTSLNLGSTAQVTSTLFREAAVSNLFYWNNIMHDILYQYGFNEASGNFQENNFSKGGIGSDAVQAEAQDGGGTNNANFATPTDGSKPRMQMFLWNGYSGGAQLDSSFDSGVIAHEYCHGLSIRLTGGPSTSSCLSGEQAGEGWSDFCALFVTATSSTGLTRASGAYIRANRNGVRPKPYSPDFSINPYTYGQAKILSNPHGIGFFFASCLWDLYQGMVQRYRYGKDKYNPNAGGNTKTFQLVVQGLKNQVCTPDFVESRDAIILADQQLYGGANFCLIWGVFARRGLGLNAVGGFVEDFDVPSGCENLRCVQFWGGTPVAPPPDYTYTKTTGCTNNPVDWYDSDGPTYNCAWFGADATRCSTYGGAYSNFGKTANQACCVCGGGTGTSQVITVTLTC